MGEKHRGRPCKEEKTVQCHFGMNTDEYLLLLRLSKYLKVSRSEAMRLALKMTCDRLFSNDDEYIEDYYEEEDEEEDDYM